MTSGRKHAVIAGLLGFVLVLFQLVLVARIVVDWVGVLSPATAGGGLYQARRITHGITEPVIAPVRRVLKPVRAPSSTPPPNAHARLRHSLPSAAPEESRRWPIGRGPRVARPLMAWTEQVNSARHRRTAVGRVGFQRSDGL